MPEQLGEALLELGTDDRKVEKWLKGAETRTQETANRIKAVFARILTRTA